MPVQVSHMKLAMRGLWGQGDQLVAKLDAARREGIVVTADVYPWTMWQSTLTVLYPNRNFTDRTETDFILKEIASPDDLVLGDVYAKPVVCGQDGPADRRAARHRSGHDADGADRRVAGSGCRARASSARGMDERDIATLLRWPFTNVCSDGELDGPHPRGFGVVHARPRPLRPRAARLDARGGSAQDDEPFRRERRHHGSRNHRVRAWRQIWCCSIP